MKKILWLAVSVLAVLLTGCASIRWDESPEPVDAISQAAQPANPVRRSESHLILGGYQMHHRQGTDNHASRVWYDGNVYEEYTSQRPYKHTTESYVSPPRYVPVMIDAPFTFPGYYDNVNGGKVFR